MAQEIYHRSEWGNPNEQWGNVYLNADLTNELYKRASEYENSWVTDQLLNGVGIKPSIILTPTAYEDGVLNSVKPKGGENFFPYSEDFENSDWTKNAGTTITNNYAISPDGTQTAARYLGTGSSGLGDKFTLSAVGHTISFWVKSNNGSNQFCRLIGDSSQVSSDILVTTEWNRISYTFTASGLSNKTNGIFRDSSNNDIDILIWGAQLERGYLGVYNPTNGTAIKNADFDFTRGSSATRVNEQGLIQDVQILSGELVQNGDFEQIGSELVTNGDFDTDSDWSKGTGWVIENGKATHIGGSSNSYLNQTNRTVVGKNYKAVFTFSGGLNSSNHIMVYGVGLYADFFEYTSDGTYTLYFTADATFFRFRAINPDNDVSIDNVSVKEVGQNWSFGTGWSMGDGKAVFVSEGVTGLLAQNNVLVANKKYRISFYTDTNLNLYLGTNTSSITTGVGNFNQEFTVVSGSDGNLGFTFNPANPNGYIDNISVIEITDDTDLPRINYTNGEGSLLLEPQRSNIITNSNSSNLNFTLDGVSMTYNSITSPDGENNGILLKQTGSNSSNSAYNFGLTTADGTYTYSIFIKSNDSEKIRFYSSNGSTLVQDFNPQEMTEGVLSGALNLKFESYGNDWFRVSFTRTLSSASNHRLSIYPDRLNTQKSIYIFGLQIESNASYATSYIPTEGSIKTRLADVCNNSGSSDLINSTEGVLYAEISALANDGTNRQISINNNGTSNRVYLEYSSVNNRIRGVVENSGGNQAILSAIVNDVKNYTKVAIKYKQNDFSLFINGFKVDTELNGGVLVGLSELSFDRGDGLSVFYGNVKCVAVFKEALSDTELQKLTTI